MGAISPRMTPQVGDKVVEIDGETYSLKIEPDGKIGIYLTKEVAYYHPSMKADTIEQAIMKIKKDVKEEKRIRAKQKEMLKKIKEI